MNFRANALSKDTTTLKQNKKTMIATGKNQGGLYKKWRLHKKHC